LNLVRWRLWEGKDLVLEMNHFPAESFHTVEYVNGGWPIKKRYRVFQMWTDNDPPVFDAQLEQEGQGFFDQAGPEP
jgi:hypothetical protein